MSFVWPCLSLSGWVQRNLWRCNSTPGRFWKQITQTKKKRKKSIKASKKINPKQVRLVSVIAEKWKNTFPKSVQLCAGCEFHLKVLVARHSLVGEFGQEHGDESGKAPLCSQLVWAHPCQPQDVFRDVWGLALEHSTPVQTHSRRGKATEGGWDGQTHAGEETSPPRWVLILGPLKGGGQERAARSKEPMSQKMTFFFLSWKDLGEKVKHLTEVSESTPVITQTLSEQVSPDKSVCVLLENRVSTLISAVMLRWKQPSFVIENTNKPVLFKRAFSRSTQRQSLDVASYRVQTAFQIWFKGRSSFQEVHRLRGWETLNYLFCLSLLCASGHSFFFTPNYFT